MTLTCLNSDSSGNSYLIHNDNECLALEAGIRFIEIKKTLKFAINKIVGVCISHAHLDHAKYVKEFANAGINCYSSSETFEHLGILSHRLCTVEPGKKYKIGNFSIIPFDLKHDVRCFGYLIHHPETGVICFITDSYFVPNKINGLNHIIVEVNYAEDILEENISKGLSAVVRNRVIQSHMSLETCKEFLLANDLTKMHNIILIHLSSGNSDAIRFKREIEETTGKVVTIADKNISICLDKRPF